MSTQYIWEFSQTLQNNAWIYIFKPYNNSSDTFEFVVPNQSNCYNFTNLDSVRIIVKANSCVFNITNQITFPRLNNTSNSSHTTHYQIDTVEIHGNTNNKKYYPIIDDSTYIGQENFTTRINLYNAYINSNTYNACVGTIDVYSYITENIEITETFGAPILYSGLYIEEGVTFTCTKITSAPGIYFTKAYLGGTLTGDFQLFASLTCLTKDERQIRGMLKDANLATDSSITIENVDIYNCTFTGNAITLNNVTYPKREEISDMPSNTQNVEFPEGFMKQTFAFPASAVLHVTGPITGFANDYGYDPIRFSSIP